MINEISIEKHEEKSEKVCRDCRYFNTDQISMMCLLVHAEDCCCYTFEHKDKKQNKRRKNV